MPVLAGRIAEVAHGYTMADVDQMAREIAYRFARRLDIEDALDYAWHAIVEHLLTISERPTRQEVKNAGHLALMHVWTDEIKQAGLDRNTFERAPKAEIYWRSPPPPVTTSPTG